MFFESCKNPKRKGVDQMEYKTRLIHNIKVKEYLHLCGIEPIEEVDNPFRKGFKSWRYYVVPELREALDEYYTREMTYEEVCRYISEEANDGRIHALVDHSGGLANEQCIFKVNAKKNLIIKVKKTKR